MPVSFVAMTRTNSPSAPRRAIALLLLAVALTACGDPPEDPADAAAATTVVEQFVGRLVYVPLDASAEPLREAIRTQYSAYVTNILLSSWLAEPYSAPGRESTTTWVDRFQSTATQRLRPGAYEVSGELLYVVTVGEEPVLREAVTAVVVQGQDDVWRISEWRE